MNNLNFATFGALLTLFASPVLAATLTTQQLLTQFNSVTTGDVTISQEIEGRTYVGGNLTSKGGAQFDLRASQTAASSYDGLVVGGSVTGGGVTMENKSGATVGGNVANQNFELNGGGTLRAGGKITANANQGTKLSGQAGTAGFSDRFIDDIGGTVAKTSAGLATLKGQDAKVSGNKAVFNAAATNGTTVYSVDFGLFSKISEIELDRNGATTVVINVSGAGGKLSSNFLGNSMASARNVVWNFYEAKTLDFTTQFMGSVLAASANISNTTPIEGSVIAKSATYNGEVHLQTFAGTLPVFSSQPLGATPVPVPAALPLLGSAIAGLAFIGRRRRKAA